LVSSWFLVVLVVVVIVVVVVVVVVVVAMLPMTNQQQCGQQTFPTGKVSISKLSLPGKVSVRRQFINKLSCN
jgi:NADH:ubiquinone oxidoreductase subunit 3 (subunit A)